jgi:citrate synthase
MENLTKIFVPQEGNQQPKLLGHDFFDLIEQYSFEALAYFLIYGQLPKDQELFDFSQRGFETRKILANNLCYEGQSTTKLIEVAQSLTASLNYYYDPWDLMNQIMMSMMLYHSPSIAPLPNYESQVLEFLIDSQPDDYENHLEATQSLLKLYIDHGLSPSTRVACLISSTQAPLHAALSGAIGALGGPLHGAALEKVVPFLQELTLQNYREEIDELLKLSKKIMGFGHSEYKKGDPRSPVAYAIAQSLASHREDDQLLELAEFVAQYVLEKKGLYPNVDYYGSIALYFLSRKSTISSLIFLFARMPGWIAHIQEQKKILKI